MRVLRLLALALMVVAGLGAILALNPDVRAYVSWRLGERMSIAARLEQFAPRVDPLWTVRLADAGLPYTPERILLLGLKREQRLEVLAAGAQGPWRALASYPVLAASGGPGPKLREGDSQVPEGRYRVTLLNPNSRFHVSLRVDYPSAEDRAQAASEGREGLGGDIMIHGGAASIGCLALGDPAIEEVFTLAARAGIARIEVLLLPHDLRVDPAFPPGGPPWMQARYQDLLTAVRDLPAARAP